MAKPLFGKSDFCISNSDSKRSEYRKKINSNKISNAVVAEPFAHDLLNAFVIHLLSCSTDGYGTHNCRRADGTTGLGTMLILKWVPSGNANEVPGTWGQSLCEKYLVSENRHLKILAFQKLPPQERHQQT